MIYEFDKEKIKIEFREFLKESDDVKVKRQKAIDISLDRKLSKNESLEFKFKIMEYKIDKGEYPVHPSAKLNNTFELEVTTTKGSLETTFVYEYDISDYLDSSGKSNPRIEMKSLISFQGFLDDEEFKLDKGTSTKIGSNLKLDPKLVKEQFSKEFDLLKYSNYKETKEKLEDINKTNDEYSKFKDLMDKSDQISKIVKKHNHPIQKLVFYKDILVLMDGYLNEKMRKDIKKYLDLYEINLWSINDTSRRKKAEDLNTEVLSNLKKIGNGKLIYISRGNEILVSF